MAAANASRPAETHGALRPTRVVSHDGLIHPSLLSALPDELVEHTPGLTVAEARRILSLAHRTGQLPAVTPAGIRRGPFLSVRSTFSVPSLSVVARRASSLDPFVKYALQAPDGAIVEAVRIPLERPGRFVSCVSSQVGCGIGCAFCATGRMGLARNLAAWEIVDQVRKLRDELPPPGRMHGVVFQGMGEPLANVREVIRSIRVMCDPSMLAIDARAITVCTSGLLPGLRTLIAELPNVRLGISIGSAIPELRAQLIPLEKHHRLADVLALAADHARATRIAPMLAYTMLAGVNDGEADIEALARLAKTFADRAGIAPRVSLIAYNPTGEGDRFAPSPADRVEAVRQAVGGLGIPVVRRYSGGADVGAACGQLGMELRGC